MPDFLQVGEETVRIATLEVTLLHTHLRNKFNPITQNYPISPNQRRSNDFQPCSCRFESLSVRKCFLIVSGRASAESEGAHALTLWCLSRPKSFKFAFTPIHQLLKINFLILLRALYILINKLHVKVQLMGILVVKTQIIALFVCSENICRMRKRAIM